MSNADAPEVMAAKEAVRSDKDETNWLLISYAAAKGDKIALTETGTGGIAELASKFDNEQAQYGYVRVEYANDAESKRVKFVLVSWIGEDMRNLIRRTRVTFEKGLVEKALSPHLRIDTSDRGDLDEKVVVTRLRKSGGADYNGGRG